MLWLLVKARLPSGRGTAVSHTFLPLPRPSWLPEGRLCWYRVWGTPADSTAASRSSCFLSGDLSLRSPCQLLSHSLPVIQIRGGWWSWGRFRGLSSECSLSTLQLSCSFMPNVPVLAQSAPRWGGGGPSSVWSHLRPQPKPQLPSVRAGESQAWI